MRRSIGSTGPLGDAARGVLLWRELLGGLVGGGGAARGTAGLARRLERRPESHDRRPAESLLRGQPAGRAVRRKAGRAAGAILTAGTGGLAGKLDGALAPGFLYDGRARPGGIVRGDRGRRHMPAWVAAEDLPRRRAIADAQRPVARRGGHPAAGDVDTGRPAACRRVR